MEPKQSVSVREQKAGDIFSNRSLQDIEMGPSPTHPQKAERNGPATESSDAGHRPLNLNRPGGTPGLACALDVGVKRPTSTQRRLVLTMRQLVEARGIGPSQTQEAPY